MPSQLGAIISTDRITYGRWTILFKGTDRMDGFYQSVLIYDILPILANSMWSVLAFGGQTLLLTAWLAEGHTSGTGGTS